MQSINWFNLFFETFDKVAWRLNELDSNTFICQIIDKRFFMIFDQEYCSSRPINSSGSTNSVNIVIRIFRRIYLYNILDMIKVYSPWYNICGDKASSFLLYVRTDYPRSSFVFKFSMNSLNQASIFRVFLLEKLPEQLRVKLNWWAGVEENDSFWTIDVLP